MITNGSPPSPRRLPHRRFQVAAPTPRHSLGVGLRAPAFELHADNGPRLSLLLYTALIHEWETTCSLELFDNLNLLFAPWVRRAGV